MMRSNGQATAACSSCTYRTRHFGIFINVRVTLRASQKIISFLESDVRVVVAFVWAFCGCEHQTNEQSKRRTVEKVLLFRWSVPVLMHIPMASVPFISSDGSIPRHYFVSFPFYELDLLCYGFFFHLQKNGTTHLDVH